MKQRVIDYFQFDELTVVEKQIVIEANPDELSKTKCWLYYYSLNKLMIEKNQDLIDHINKLTDKIIQFNTDKPDVPDDIFSNLDLETVRKYLEHAEITAFSESCQVKTFALYMDYYRGIDFTKKFNFVQKISIAQPGRFFYVQLGRVVLKISYNDVKFISNHNICNVRLLITD